MAMYFTAENFEKEVLESDIPVMVDFRADWCGPCKMLEPTLAEIEAEAEGFKLGYVDTDASRELAMSNVVMSIPTIIVFKNGQEAARIMGVQPKEKILALLEA